MNRYIILFLLTLSITACSKNGDNETQQNGDHATPTSQSDKSRFALVIGNGNYQNVPSQPHSVNDAEDMAAALKHYGFKVYSEINPDRETLKNAIRDFGQRLRGDNIGLFYFSGYALQFNNRNYLIPRQAKIKNDSDIEFESLDVHYVLRQMEQHNAQGINLVILEASRENPYTHHINHLEKGLAELKTPNNFLIASAAAPNTVSYENNEQRNSLYTKHLLTALREKAFMRVFSWMTEVTKQVATETDGTQVPWYSDQLIQSFCFGECGSPPDEVSPLPEEQLRETESESEGPPLTEEILSDTRPEVTQKQLKLSALVMGNSNYQTLSLPHSVNDAEDMAERLKDLGFEVTMVLNADKRTMKKVVYDFGISLANSDISLFYFSGQSLPFNNRNYLVPVQADIQSEPDIELEGLVADYVIQQMQQNNSQGSHIIILDACRKNLQTGLADINTPPGFLLAYANAPNWGCYEEPVERNSIYTQYLLTALRDKPIVKAVDLLKEVTRQVELKTKGQQVPWHSTTLTESPLCFGQCADWLLSSESVKSENEDSPPLQECEAHLKANRLTTGQGGTAFACYQQVLQQEPDNAEALAGLKQIEQRYITWIKSALDSEQPDKAERYLASLRLVNPNSPATLAEWIAQPDYFVSTMTIPQPSHLTPSGAAGQKWRDTLPDGSLGPEMIWISAGRFRMGDIQATGNADEHPVHWVTLKSFAMGRYEITFAEYDLFAEATGRDKPDDEGWGRDNRPVINISLEDASAYAKWLSEQTNRHYRLPTEAQWEYAARAGKNSDYWWGHEMGTNQANCAGSGSQWSDQQTAPVGSFEPNPYGLYDTTGNVWEWTCSAFDLYQGLATEQRCVGSNDTSIRSLRGGSWFLHPKLCRIPLRNGSPLDKTYNNVGFRLVVMSHGS